MAANWHDANMNVVANKPTYGRPRTAAPVISQFGKKGTSFDARADRAREDAREMANLRKQGRADAPPVTTCPVTTVSEEAGVAARSST